MRKIEMLEKEYKTLLTKEIYTAVDQLFKWQDAFTQINFYYIDKEHSLAQKDISIRIRAKKDNLYLQVKVPPFFAPASSETDSALHIKEEFQCDFATIPEKIDGELLASLTGLSFPDVEMIGMLITERKLYRKGSIGIFLDNNYYLNTQDFELEVEFTNKYPLDILEQFSNYGVDFNQKSPGKYTRFFNKYLDAL